MSDIVMQITDTVYADKSTTELADAFKKAKLLQESLRPNSMEFKRLNTFQNECLKHIRKRRAQQNDTITENL